MRGARWVAGVAAASMVFAGAARAEDVDVQSTTDTVDAGLVDGLIKPAFAAAYPNDKLNYVAPPGGTGAAIDNAKAGLADAVVTHSAAQEADFVSQGYSVGLGHQIFFSDYVIVGPKSDPAGVGTAGHAHDAIGAFEDIAKAGALSPLTVGFKSRGNSSGTAVQEQIMWCMTQGVPLQTATAANGNTSRCEPNGTQSWYTKTQAGQLANLNQTEACAANTNPGTQSGCYTMVDRGTYNRAVNGFTGNPVSVTHLKIVSDNNDTSARGGKNLLINPFNVYVVSDTKVPPTTSNGNTTPNPAAGQKFVNLLIGAGFQEQLKTFPDPSLPAFTPDAFTVVKFSPGPPTAVTSGSSFTLNGTVANALPGAPAVSGQSVQLQQSTDDGSTYTNAGSPVTTDANGAFSVSAAPSQQTRYRVSLDAHPALPYTAFTASTTDVGVVGVTAAATPTAVPTVPPAEDVDSFVTDDGKAPNVTKIKLTRKRLSLHVNESATVSITVSRNGHKRFKVKLESGSAETLTAKHKAISRGRYRLTITATDATGNRRTLKKSVSRR